MNRGREGGVRWGGRGEGGEKREGGSERGETGNKERRGGRGKERKRVEG